ncbi:hypothetical protein [Arthrobacter polaris]|uniref:hypothetical protein n=1 Tax=Arthrobacter polaris TaxID=2813727 RepID=UPI0038993A37|nr:hypothetical protein J0916_00750 [Arthrobacter polaris]
MSVFKYEQNDSATALSQPTSPMDWVTLFPSHQVWKALELLYGHRGVKSGVVGD